MSDYDEAFQRLVEALADGDRLEADMALSDMKQANADLEEEIAAAASARMVRDAELYAMSQLIVWRWV